MKQKKIWVPLFEWAITLLEVQAPKDHKKVNKILKEFGVDEESRKRIKDENIRDCINGGDHFYSKSMKKSIIVLSRMSNNKQRNHILCHEKRHIEDRMMETYCINDVETAGMLAGYLGKKLI